jgi:hypothetical protein
LKKCILFLLVLSSFNSFSQEDSSFSDIRKKIFENKVRLNYTLVNMPINKVDASRNLHPTMGLIGLHYNIPINNWLYVGAGMHAAITGDQGGLFTLGVNLGINKQLYKNIYLDANLHFGGGGGFRYLVNGGAIFYPNIGLQYKKKNYSFGVQYSSVDFFTGIIKSNNISFFVEIPSVITYVDYKNSQKKFIKNNTSKDDFWVKPATKSVQQITFDYFFPFGKSRKSGVGNFDSVTNTLSIIGFEYQKYLTKNSFVYVHTDAMYKGLTAGFMDLFFGLGKNFIETKNINFFGKFGVGAAGGRIYPEGGLTIYPSFGADFKLTKSFGFGLHGGYHRAIGGTFEAYTAGFSFKYYGLSGGVTHPHSGKKIKTIKTQGFQISLENQTYFKVAKQSNVPVTNLQQIALKMNYNLNKRSYLFGETSFAYEGKAGSYAHGIFGIGLKTNKIIYNKFSSYLELGIGAAGGGAIDTGEGLLVRPTLGINYHVNNNFAFTVSGGQMIAPYGNVNSSNLNIGCTYGLSFLKAKK